MDQDDNRCQIFQLAVCRLLQRSRSAGYGLLFYELRGMMVGINAALTIGYWLAVLGTLLSLSMLLIFPAHLALGICLGVDTIYWWLWRLERHEAKFHRLKPFSIFNINIGSARVLCGTIVVGHLFLAS